MYVNMCGNKICIKFICILSFFLLCFFDSFAQRNVIYVNVKYVNCYSTIDRWISDKDFDKLKFVHDTTIVITVNEATQPS